MSFEISASVLATPEKIFAIYAAVSDWPSWDYEVEYASMNGAFVLGGMGKVKPKGVSETKIEITELTPNKSVTTTCNLPLCKMHFVHEMSAENERSTLVVNKVVFTGLLAPVFRQLIGKSIAKTMPASLQGLKKHAEA